MHTKTTPSACPANNLSMPGHPNTKHMRSCMPKHTHIHAHAHTHLILEKINKIGEKGEGGGTVRTIIVNLSEEQCMMRFLNTCSTRSAHTESGFLSMSSVSD